MRSRTILIGLAVALAACGGKNIETVPGPVYMLTVHNPMSHAMDVWYDDGAETVELGRVEPSLTREFVIAGAASDTVEVIARDNDRTHTISRTVALARGTSPRVSLTP